MATDLERLVVQMSADIKGLDRQMKKAGLIADNTAKKIETRFAKANKKLESFGSGFLKGALGGAVGAVLAGINVNAIREAVKGIGDLADLSGKIGIAADQIQALRYAAEQSGGSIEAIDTGLIKFVKNVSDAGRGTGDLYNVLKANGVALRDQAGNLKSSTDLFGVYADLVAHAKNPQDQLNLAVMAFGKAAGPDLVGLLKQGSAGVDELTAKARTVGRVLGNDVVKEADDLDDKLSELEGRLSTTFGEFAVKTAPLLVEGLQRINDLMSSIAAILNSWPIEKLNGLIKWADRSGALSAINPLAGISKSINDVGSGFSQISDRFGSDPVARGFQVAGTMTPNAGLQSALDAAAAKKAASISKPTKATVVPSSGFGQTNDYERAVKSIKDRTQAVVAETNAQAKLNPLVNDYGFAVEKARAQQDLLTAAMDAGIKITPELKKQIDELATGYAAVSVDAARLADQQASALDAARAFGDTAYSAIDGLLFQGETLNDVFVNLAKAIGEAALQAALLGQGPLAGLLGGGSSGGGIGGIVGSIISAVLGGVGGGGAGAAVGGIGHRAGGGPVSAGRPYVVGEKGIELFSPSTSGTIIPNHALGRRGGVMNVNLNQTISLAGANGDESVRRISVETMRSAAPALLETVKRSMPKWQADRAIYES